MRIEILFFAILAFLISSARADGPLQFTQTEFNKIQAGYVTLEWNPVPGAAEYELSGAGVESVYRGPLPTAFVSGLADGTYEFRVEALDDVGRVLASSEQPAIVQVEHWSLRFALLLLSCGFAVFVALVGLIIQGTLATRSVTAAPASQDRSVT